MSVGETARKNYESARNELLLRIQLRDNIYQAFIGAVGLVFGVALSTNAKPSILLVIPYLCLGASILIVHHHSIITSLLEYLTCELQPFFLKIGEHAPEWVSSNALTVDISRVLKLRTLANYLLVFIPSILGLSISWQYCMGHFLSLGLLWWLGAITSIYSGVLVHTGYKRRISLQKHMEEVLRSYDILPPAKPSTLESTSNNETNNAAHS